MLSPVSAQSNAIRRLKNGKTESPIGYSCDLSDIKMFGDEYSVHSTRGGGLLAMVMNGARGYQIQLAGGWESSAMIAYYSRELNVEAGAMRAFSETLGC